MKNDFEIICFVISHWSPFHLCLDDFGCLRFHHLMTFLSHVGGCENLHQLIGVSWSIPLFIGFQVSTMQDFFHPPYHLWWGCCCHTENWGNGKRKKNQFWPHATSGGCSLSQPWIYVHKKTLFGKFSGCKLLYTLANSQQSSKYSRYF